MSTQQFARDSGAVSYEKRLQDGRPARGSSAGMPARTRSRARAGIVAAGPAVLLAGVAYHPYIAKPIDKAAIAAALNSDHGRWGLSHLAVGVGSGLLALAFLAIRSYLSDAGEHRWSMRALPLIVFGCVLFAMLPAMEIGVLAGAQGGADVTASQTALDKWFVPVLVVGGLLYLLGSIGFARAIVSSGAFPSGTASFVSVALVIAAVSRFVPLGASLFVGGAALAAALWPLAVSIARQSVDVAPDAPGERKQPRSNAT